MKKNTAPDELALRTKFLKQIRDAKSLAELENIKLLNANATNWLRYFERPDGLSEKHYNQIRLLLTQVKELREQRDFLADRVELLSEYHSPLWDDARNEPCPIKEAEIRRKVHEEETTKNQERLNKQRLPLDGLMAALGVNKTHLWKSRDRRVHRRPWPALWHEPMSVMGYHNATGLTRRTIQNMLDRLAATPIAPRKRSNEPARYGLKVNHAILCDWLMRCVKDPNARRGLLARTLLHCQRETAQHYPRLKKAVKPVLGTLDNLEQDFDGYLAKCKRLLYPPYKPSSLDKTLGLPDLSQLYGGTE
jgi:hypothetical protein